ncbi:hypothetical protein F4827_003845 [Paraburkholderia bannensis]|uniref:Uncharacterized protein n=1 Tax=Paraburkholderia bannensis TaxID=765414 RepID=A0A7W9U0F4_9BURK|nr:MULTISPECIES: hypothetical protein [Paraburkholderia]MBB3258972.1 hypothetical protein [Paraburkholderia sp. WP4_3_2]MBB6103986.1 hypothetical protein [Paraburkholderia bannensis]
MLNLAFWRRDVMLYESTPALHRLMEESDVGDDIPAAALRLPAPAICVLPPADERSSPGGLAAVMAFEHAVKKEDGSFSC